MSDFLNFVDEIIDGEPKYNITDNVDGTKSIELANEVVQEGTQLNKLGFNKLNAVLGYNECNVSQISQEEELEFIASFTRNENKSITIGSYATKEVGELNYGIKVSIQNENNAGKTLYLPSTNYPDFLSYTNSISTNNNGHLDLLSTGLVTNILFSSPIKIKKMRTYISRGNAKITLYKDSQVIVSESYMTVGQNTLDYGEYKEINKIKLESDYSSGNMVAISLDEIKANVTTYNNVFTTNNFSFINNQRILIETPNYSINNVTSNTLNGIAIEELLLPNKKYELIYNEQINKFVIKNEIIFEITLNEAVNQVDLIGISKILKAGKLYELQVYGTGVSSSGYMKFLNTDLANVMTSTTNIYLIFAIGNEAIIGNGYAYNVGNFTYSLLKSNIKENIRMSDASSTFNAGTRIIIKEVA